MLGLGVQTLYAQSIAVTGRVKNKNTGELLVGASVSVKGKSVALTDANGRFSLNTAVGSVLEITYTGLITSKVTVVKAGEVEVSLEQNPADVLIFRDNDSINPNMGQRRNFDMQGPPPFAKIMKGRKRMRGAMTFGRMGGRNKMGFEHQKNGSKTIHGLISYPNKPFNGKLNVRFKAPEKGIVTISVTDVNGKEIASEQIKDFSGLYLGQIDVKKSGAGVYFVRVTQSNDGAVRRVQVD